MLKRTSHIMLVMVLALAVLMIGSDSWNDTYAGNSKITKIYDQHKSSSCSKAKSTSKKACAKTTSKKACSKTVEHKYCTEGTIKTYGKKHCDGKHCDEKHCDEKHCDGKHCDGKHCDGKHCDGKCDHKHDCSHAGCACCKRAATEIKAKELSALKKIVTDLPYRENKRLLLTGYYVCGKCKLEKFETCKPLFKTTDGDLYPLVVNHIARRMEKTKSADGFKITTLVKRIDGVKYLEVKRFEEL